MGWRYEVEVWVRLSEDSAYKWMPTYTGQSLYRAWRSMREARRNGVGCIRLTWRPTT